MRNLVILFYLVLFYSIFIHIACSKVNYDSKGDYTAIELTDTMKTLVDKRWMEVLVEVKHPKLDSTQATNITHQFLRSDLDDLLIFSDDGTYQFDEGKSKSREESKQVYEQGNWSIVGSHLVLMTNNSKTHYLIKQLSAGSLVLKLPVKNEEYYYVLTYRSE